MNCSTFYVLILIAYSAALNALCMDSSSEIGTNENVFGMRMLIDGIFDLIQVSKCFFDLFV